MARTHFIKCDGCGESMLFQREIDDGVQFYRCFSYADRWAIVGLNRHGGVTNIQYETGSYAKKAMLALGLANSLGKAIWKK
jgi:hypothetical protein